MSRIFFSYSHRDEDIRNELEVHLKSLQRQGLIETWHDRRILSGSEVDNSISEELERADIILLLVSPYFIASDYCYKNEMIRALERHKSGSARVIPVILHPCDWHELPFGKLLATPNDGKAISKYPNIHDAFLEVTLAIKAAVKTSEPVNWPDAEIAALPIEPDSSPFRSELRSANLRVKKEFRDRDVDEFIDQTFEYIANYIEGSLLELETRNPDLDCRFRRIDASHFSAKIYRHGATLTQCKIWMSGQGSRFGGNIMYSSSADGSDSSYNEQLSVKTDGYILGLNALGMSTLGFSIEQGKRNELLTAQGAAEYYWSILIRPVQ